eukprot:tig00001428_g8730.t1
MWGRVIRRAASDTGGRLARRRLRAIADAATPIAIRPLHGTAVASSSTSAPATAPSNGAPEQKEARKNAYYQSDRMQAERIQRRIDALAGKLSRASQQAAVAGSMEKAIAAIVSAAEEEASRAPKPQEGAHQQQNQEQQQQQQQQQQMNQWQQQQRRPYAVVSIATVSTAAVRSLLAAGDASAAERIVEALRNAGHPRSMNLLLLLFRHLILAHEHERWQALARAEGLPDSILPPRQRSFVGTLAIGRCMLGEVEAVLAEIQSDPRQHEYRTRILFRALAGLVRQRRAAIGPRSAAALGAGAPSSQAAFSSLLTATSALPGFPSSSRGLLTWLAVSGLRGAPPACLEDFLAAAATDAVWRPALPGLRRAAAREAVKAGRVDVAERIAAAAEAALEADARDRVLLEIVLGKLRAGRTKDGAEAYEALAGRVRSRRALAAMGNAAPELVRHGAAPVILAVLARWRRGDSSRAMSAGDASLPADLRAAAELLSRRGQAAPGPTPSAAPDVSYNPGRDAAGMSNFAVGWARALLASNEREDQALVAKTAAAAAPLCDAKGRRSLMNAEWTAGLLLEPRTMQAAVEAARAFLEGLNPEAPQHEIARAERVWRPAAGVPVGIRGLLETLFAARPRRAAEVAAVLDARGARALLGPRAWHAWRARALLEAGPAAGSADSDLLPAFRELHLAEQAGDKGGAMELATAYERLELPLRRPTFEAMRAYAAGRGNVGAARHWARHAGAAGNSAQLQHPAAGAGPRRDAPGPSAS